MTPIRALDIRKGERWTPGRVAIHIAMTTQPDATLLRPKRRWRIWRYIAGTFFVPSAAALAIVMAWQILRRGL